MTEQDWDQVLDVNLKGACFCAQAAAKAMVSVGPGGDRQPDPGRRLPQLAKGGALRREQRRRPVDDAGMALELAPYRIRVNAIAPGLTDTAQPRYGSSEAELAETARAIPLGRMARPKSRGRRSFWLPTMPVS